MNSVSKRLKREHRRLKSWQKVADLYSDPGEGGFKMNRRWPWELVTLGKVPTDLEVCYRLGLLKRPKPKAEKPLPTAFKLLWLQMAAETRAALKSWKGERVKR